MFKMLNKIVLLLLILYYYCTHIIIIIIIIITIITFYYYYIHTRVTWVKFIHTWIHLLYAEHVLISKVKYVFHFIYFYYLFTYVCI